MAQYINKSAVMAEIERLKGYNVNERDDFEKGYHNALNLICSFLDTIDAEKVDLEKEIKDFLRKQPIAARSQGTDLRLVPSPKEIAEHFYELGLKAVRTFH